MRSSVDRTDESRPDSGRQPVAAYVVLTHRDPEQVERLVAAIRRSSPRCHILVAHDARRSRAPKALDARVHVWEHGLRTDWGSWELVQATLEAFDRVRGLASPDLVALLSGSDYPVLNLADWERSFLSSGGGWLGDAIPLSYQPRWGRRLGEGQDDLTRYTYRWIRMPRASLGDRLPRSIERLLSRVRDGIFLRIEPLLTRRVVTRGRGAYLGVRRLRTPFSNSRPCSKGSQWVVMDQELLDYLLQVACPGSHLARFYRHTIIPDEGLIPTVLLWRQRPSGPRPINYLLPREVHASRYAPDVVAETLRHGDEPFCRTVDEERRTAPIPAELMEAIDQRLEH